ncbi:MAG: hypothetical protein J0G36_05020 [Afipia sp.]|nr:hypothetical protein [Afipia sp.]
MVTKSPQAAAALPSPQEAAIILLRLIELREKESLPATRVRISELTLRRLWGRSKIRTEFFEEVQEWLARGGWTLFFAHDTYAAIRTNAVRSWARLSSKRLANDLELIRKGKFDFQAYAYLLDDMDDTSDD